MTKKLKRAIPDVAVVQITEGSLSIVLDFTKLDDGVLEEIAEMAKRQLAHRATRRSADAHRCPQHKELP